MKTLNVHACACQLMHQLNFKRLHYKKKTKLIKVYNFLSCRQVRVHFQRLQQVNVIRNRFDLVTLMLLM